VSKLHIANIKISPFSILSLFLHQISIKYIKIFLRATVEICLSSSFVCQTFVISTKIWGFKIMQIRVTCLRSYLVLNISQRNFNLINPLIHELQMIETHSLPWEWRWWGGGIIILNTTELISFIKNSPLVCYFVDKTDRQSQRTFYSLKVASLCSLLNKVCLQTHIAHNTNAFSTTTILHIPHMGVVIPLFSNYVTEGERKEN